MNIITKESIKQDIIDLGIKKGDVLFITGGMKSIGNRDEIEGNIYNFFVDTLLEIVGEEGTIATYAYTKAYLTGTIKNTDVFTIDTPSDSGGAIANIFLNHDGAVRSTHPTSSCVAIGKKAHELLDAHTYKSSAYSVLGKFVEINAKLIVFGCLDTNPGMPLLHYVEEQTGLLKKNNNFLNNFGLGFGTYFFNENNEKKLLIRNDDGGCYYGSYSFFKDYDNRKLWVKGNIGKSIAVQVSARDSFNLEYEILSKHPERMLCNNPNCIRCNFLTPRKKYALLKFFTYKIWTTLFFVIIALLSGKGIKSVILKTDTGYDINNDEIFANVVKKINKLYN